MFSGNFILGLNAVGSTCAGPVSEGALCTLAWLTLLASSDAAAWSPPCLREHPCRGLVKITTSVHLPLFLLYCLRYAARTWTSAAAPCSRKDTSAIMAIITVGRLQVVSFRLAVQEPGLHRPSRRSPRYPGRTTCCCRRSGPLAIAEALPTRWGSAARVSILDVRSQRDFGSPYRVHSCRCYVQRACRRVQNKKCPHQVVTC